MGKKSIAVMQPYLFPYLGYFQLIEAVDEFVFYDDVNYIKQGWINRNRILVNNDVYTFTVPLKKPSPFKLINETEINPSLFPKWKKKFLKTVQQAYKKAPQFEKVYPIIEQVFESEGNLISDLAVTSVEYTCRYLGLEKKFHISSEDFPSSKELTRSGRLIAICKSQGSSRYVNTKGGQTLYDKNEFKKEGIDLEFLEPVIKPYSQFSEEFISGLSIIDLLMFNDSKSIKGLLSDYKLI